MSTAIPQLPVSLIVVSDYEAGGKTWADERAAVSAFLADTNGAPAEIVIMEAKGPDQVPPDIAALAPRVQVYFADTKRSAGLKDAGLAHCTQDLVAVIEADCLPEPGWLKLLYDGMRGDPALDAVSSLTTYGARTSLLRVMSLLDRGFIAEKDGRGRFMHVANNGALYRRHVLKRFPYPDDPSPFVSAELRLVEMQRAGIRIGLEPRARMRHAYGGPAFIADVRRNKGYQAARIVMARGRPATRVRLVMRTVGRNIRNDIAAISAASGYFLKWWDWPLLIAMMLVLRGPEIQGALKAGQPEAFAKTTSYR
jgi:hypothetical protein